MRDVFHNLKWFFRERAKDYVFCLISLVIVSVVPVFPTKLLGLFIDDISTGALTRENFLRYVIGLIGLPILIYLTNILFHYNIHKLGQDLSYSLRERYISHLFDMDVGFYEKYTKGDLIARVTNDMNNLANFATQFLKNSLYYSFCILAALVMMLRISPLLTLATCSFMPGVIFFLNKKRKKKRQVYKIHHEIYANMTENVLESVEGVKTVRAYGREDWDYAKTKKAIVADIDSWRSILTFETMFKPLFEMVYAVAYLIAIGLGSYMVTHSQMSPGTLVTYLVYVGMFNAPLVGLAEILNQTNAITISNNRFFAVMNEVPRVHDLEDARPITSFRELSFRHITYRYPSDDFDVISDISFDIHAGDTIGVVGPTGCGKSTLIRQLLREFDPTSGDIYIDGTPLEQFRIEDIRGMVGYVPQTHVLFHRTVDDNILIGNPDATEKMIQRALTVSEFKKDLSALPSGLDTMVAEAGESLSGGQKQRLSIARALVKDPQILILDDSLSAVDAVTEADIIRHLKETRKGKTNIIVAHRFSAVKAANKIIVMQEGVITDIGTHEQLLGYDNWYKEQYLRQLRGDYNE